MIDHKYKGFILRRSGYVNTRWNIYNKNGDWVGYGRTMSECKNDIDAGCFD